MDSKRQYNVTDMVGVPIDDFVTGKVIPVDVYVKLSENKFVKVANAGSSTSKQSLSSYQNKKVETLWVLKSEYFNLTHLHLQIAGVVVSRDEISAGQKTSVVTAAANSIFTELDLMGINEKVYGSGRRISESIVKLVEHQKDLSGLMISLNNYSDELLRHSMAVSVFSVLCGIAMNWKKDDVLERLGLGGLLHDIGKKVLNPELLKKSKFEMNFDEIKEYETHPFKGMQMLTQLSIVPREVVSMAYEHHENSLAQGFPQKLRDYRINPFARIVAFSNELANLTIKNPTHQRPLKPLEALDYIESTMGQPFNRDVFKAFKTKVFAFNVQAA